MLITIDNSSYICNEYIEKDTIQPISRLRFKYDLKKVGENKFEFILKVVSEYKGKFEVVEEDGYLSFINLSYVKTTSCFR